MLCSTGGLRRVVRGQTAGDLWDLEPASTSAVQEFGPERRSPLVVQRVRTPLALGECRRACAQQKAHDRKANTKRSRLTNKCPNAYRLSSAPKERTARDSRMPEF